MRLVSGIPSGWMVEKLGERLVLGTGLYMVALSMIASALSQSYLQLLIFRTAGGLGSVMFSVSANSLILRVTQDSDRGRAQSLYNGGFLIGGIAGPAFGGLLISISPRAPFYIYAITLTIAATIALFFLHERRLGDRASSNSNLGEVMSIRDAMRIRPYVYALILAFISNWVLFGMRSSILPLYVIEDLKGTATLVGISFALAALAQGLVMVRAGRYADRHGRRPVLITGYLLVGVSLIILIFSFAPWVFTVAMVVMGFGAAMAASNAAIVGDVIKGKSSRAVAVWQMAGDAGMMVGPILLGYVSDLSSFRSAIALTGVIFLFALAVALKIPETNSSRLGDSSRPQIQEA